MKDDHINIFYESYWMALHGYPGGFTGVPSEGYLLWRRGGTSGQKDTVSQ